MVFLEALSVIEILGLSQASGRNYKKLLGTHVKMSTTGHPQTDGQTENANRTLLQLLRCYAGKNPRNWDELLAIAELAYNSQKQTSTGKSPFIAIMAENLICHWT
jgi:hypothetical protein